MKRLTLFIILMCCALGIAAQEIETPEIDAQNLSPKEQINAIKRDSSFVYAEATDSTVSAALDAANVQLILHIKDYIQLHRQLQDADMVLVKDKAAKCERIEMQRGDKFRVFVYVKKADIMPAQTVTYIPKSAWQAMEKTPSVEGQNVDSVEVQEDASVELQEEASVKMQEVSVDFSDLKDWQQSLIGNFLKCEDMNDCLIFLDKMRIQKKVKRIGGRDDAPRNPQQVFYAVFASSGKLKTVLGKESDGYRINYVSGQKEQLTQYATDDIVWFSLSN